MSLARNFLAGEKNLKYNTYIGGIGNVVTTAQKLIEVMYDSSEPETFMDISNFETNGTDIRFRVSNRYKIRSACFSAYSQETTGVWYSLYGDNRTMTHYIDLEGKCLGFSNRNFLFQENLSFVFFPDIASILGVGVLRLTEGAKRYLYGEYTSLYNASEAGSINDTFRQTYNASPLLYCKDVLQTSNNGGLDASLNRFITEENGTVIYLIDSTVPSDVQNELDLITNNF